MLVLTRKAGQEVQVADAVIRVEKIQGNRVRLSIDAPPSVQVLRGELLQRKDDTDEQP